MDSTFAENIDLMQQQHSSLTANIQVATTKATDEAITKLHSEMIICTVNISKEILDSPTINDKRDIIIVDIGQCCSTSLRAINKIVTTSQITCDSHIARMNSQQVNIKADTKDKYNDFLKNLLDYRDGALINIVEFQSKLQGEIKQSMQALLTNNTTKLRNDLYITIIDHNTRLRATSDNIKQDIKIALFLDLQEEQERIKKDLIADLQLLKNESIVEIKVGPNQHITELDELQHDIITEANSSIPAELRPPTLQQHPLY